MPNLPNLPVPDPEGGAGPQIDPVAEARKALTLAKRDFAGFIEGDQPNVNEDQLFWLSHRMSQSSDEGALTAIELEDEENFSLMVWQDRLNEWRMDPVFVAVEQITLGNKREGFKLLSVHMAGKVLRRMDSLLDSPDPKIVIRAMTLWSRHVGLLIDKINVVDRDELARLAERMTQSVTITPLKGPSIEGEWTETSSKSQETSGST